MAVDDPVLGRVLYESRLDCWRARVDLGLANPVDLYLEVSGQAPTEVAGLLHRGAAFLEWVRQMEPECRQRVADELLECYNNDWAAEEGQEGSGQIGREEFLRDIVLQSLVLSTDGSACLSYTDGGLFGGHRIDLRLRADRTISQVGLAG